MDKDNIEWERLAKKLRKLPYKARKYNSGTITISYSKFIRVTICVAGLDIKDSKKFESVIVDAQTIKEAWKKALKIYSTIKKDLS